MTRVGHYTSNFWQTNSDCTEPTYEQFGKLTYEMLRAYRLVVDTGIHAKGWSREQVVAYMLENTALSEH